MRGHLVTVGFFGLGAMGGTAAENISRSGSDTVARKFRREADEDHPEMDVCCLDTPKLLSNRADCVVSRTIGVPRPDAILRGGASPFEGACEGRTAIHPTNSSPACRRDQVRDFVAGGGKPADAPAAGAVTGLVTRRDAPSVFAIHPASSLFLATLSEAPRAHGELGAWTGIRPEITDV